MSRIRAADTKPEKIVRSILHRVGFRFGLHVKSLPGKPDIVLPKYKTVVFVHGCFWHCHKGCRRANVPKTNKKYWVPKLERNLERDKINKRALKKDGWRIITVWECEVKKELKVFSKLKPLFEEKKSIDIPHI